MITNVALFDAVLHWEEQLQSSGIPHCAMEANKRGAPALHLYNELDKPS